MSKKIITKISTTVVSLATVISLSGAGALVPVAYGATTEDLQAQINALLAQVAALQSQLSGSTTTVSGTVPASLLSSGNLTVGSKGAAVKDLQMYLNGAGYVVAASGAGSVGNETEYFGSLTKAALAKWQAANGVSPAAGYFGPITRTKLSTVSGGVVAPAPVSGVTPAPVPVPAGSGLTATLAADQPAASLAPFNATRIPFTKVHLIASADGPVTVTSITVMRTGLSEDAALSGIVLLDENGIQLGLEKTLNSDHTVTVGESVTINAGQTRTFIVAGRRAAAGSRGGQTVALAVTGVTTSTKVSATFPLTGTTHTVNETLSVGTLTSPQAGPLDPGASQTKEIGTANYTFSSVRVTAGSEEKVILKSIRWNQSGSAAKSDLANVKSYVDGVGYDTVVSADGKFYTSTFGSGILIEKGFNKEISIKGDVVGGSARKVDFDIDKRSDVYAVGDTFGYGILAANGTDSSGTDDGAFHLDTNPWFDAYEVHVSAGTITVSKWNGVQAQNVAVNLADQPLGGWSVDVKGEAISVGSLVFHLDNTNSAGDVGLNDLDSIKLVDENGKTLAGPIDPTATTVDGNITFTDTITFPVGVTNMKMLAKYTTDWDNNDTASASTTPSTGWTSVTGQTTGNSITPSPTSGVAGNAMTVKASALTISVSSVPIAQTIIAGSNQFEFARYILDTSSSGEDLRLVSFPAEYNMDSGNAADLTNCFLYDGSVKLNSASVVNPSARGSSTSFVFDGTGLTLTKGTSRQLALKCDLIAAATGSYRWGYDSSSSPSPTGLVSGQAVASGNLTENDSSGQLMTAATSGTLTVALDTVASYALVAPGDTVELVRLKYSATNEDVNVKQVTLNISRAASNTPLDLVGQEVTLWDGTTGEKLGTAVFSGSEAAGAVNRATGTLSSFVVAKDGSRVLVVKGTIAGVSNSGPNTRSGDFLTIDYDGGGGLTSNHGTGVSSGQTVTPTSAVTVSTGVRLMKAYPTVSFVDLDSGEKTLAVGSARTLYKFKVTATKGDILLGKFSFAVSSSTLAATTTNYQLYVYTDSSFSTIDSQINSTGAVNNTSCKTNQPDDDGTSGGIHEGSGMSISPDTSSGGCGRATTSLKISSGQSRWFKLVGSIASLAAAGTTETLEVGLQGDAAFPVAHQGDGGVGEMGQFGIGAGNGVFGVANNDFIWSPTSTTTASSAEAAYLNRNDWTNGYGVPGLPATDLSTVSITHQ